MGGSPRLRVDQALTHYDREGGHLRLKVCSPFMIGGPAGLKVKFKFTFGHGTLSYYDSPADLPKSNAWHLDRIVRRE